jgi:hypothetical protein
MSLNKKKKIKSVSRKYGNRIKELEQYGQRKDKKYLANSKSGRIIPYKILKSQYSKNMEVEKYHS